MGCPIFQQAMILRRVLENIFEINVRGSLRGSSNASSIRSSNASQMYIGFLNASAMKSSQRSLRGFPQ
jgi:hypothetical protein